MNVPCRPLIAAAALAAIALGACTTVASRGNDVLALNNLAGCYTEGIDAIGNGNTDAGAATWRQCFIEDLRFTLSFGPSFSMTCPGEKCPLPASMSGLARRVAAARATYDRAGYVATSHHLTSLVVEQSGADSARIKAHLQAWHQRRDGTTVLGLGTWQVEARRTAAGWRIAEEQLDSPQRVVVPKTE
jgi:hypothetical protein